MLDDACDGDAKCVCVLNAIFIHDSSWATAGVGKRTKNPCNTRPSDNHPRPFTVEHTVNGPFARFSTLNDGIESCVEVWRRGYQDKSAFDTAKIWTGNRKNKDYGKKKEERAYINAIGKCF